MIFDPPIRQACSTMMEKKILLTGQRSILFMYKLWKYITTYSILNNALYSTSIGARASPHAKLFFYIKKWCLCIKME